MTRKVLQRLWLVAALLVSWEALSRWRVLNPLFFPPPSKLLAVLGPLIWGGSALDATGHTLTRTAIGFAAGIICGALISAAISSVPWIRSGSEPVVSAMYASPRLTLLPMAMLIFGVNDSARIVLVALSTMLIVVIQVSDAIRGVNPAFVDLARNYGASQAMVLRKVYLPACLPQFFTALRLSFGRAFVLTISIELLSAGNGLGNMIWAAWQTFYIERLYVCILLAAMIGLLCQMPFRVLERHFTKWRGASA